MSRPIDEALHALPARLRALRRRSDLTLTQLSASTGIPVSTLSRFEAGHRRPALEQVLRLAEAHGVSVDELIDAPPTGDARVHLRPVVRDGKTLIPLTRRPGGIQAYKLVLPGADSVTVPRQSSHEGFEWLYVLNNRLRLLLADEELILRPGEVAEFDTRLPHWFGAADPHPTELLALLGNQGQRAHVRAAPKPR